MSSQFSYLLDKVRSASFVDEPFTHLQITNFLSPQHFAALVQDPQVALNPARDTRHLLDLLESSGYSIIPFPGCVTSKVEYLAWLEARRVSRIHETTEGCGIVLRLTDFRSDLIAQFNEFLTSPEFQAVLIEKFGLSGEMIIDAGVQKYLHGYEISPHPDIRRKALTWMLNLNPGGNSEDRCFHTHYLKLKPEWRFIAEFWKGNPEVERDWLPWSWCETVKQQTANNSIVIFAPSDDTLHAVRADYDHHELQRTQFYGNLWEPARKLAKVSFADFDIGSIAHDRLEKETRRAHFIGTMKSSTIGKRVVALRDGLRARHIDTVRTIGF